MSEDFRQKVRMFAQRVVALAPRCTNEESTKLFLILPFLNFLGYDDRNPDEVHPEHHADFSEKYKNKVDFAILQNGHPIIAIECKTLGLALKDERGQLRSYFNAASTVKMGVITDGLVYEFSPRSPLFGRGLGTFNSGYRILDNQYLALLIAILLLSGCAQQSVFDGAPRIGIRQSFNHN